MKKQFILVAMMFAGTAAFAQNDNQQKQAKPATTVTTAQEGVQAVDEKKISAAHWMAAKRQLESAKDHLLKAKFDPGNQRENAIRSIELALREVNQALSMNTDTPKKDDGHKKHDHSDPNHKH